jgi:hypothetical protein
MTGLTGNASPAAWHLLRFYAKKRLSRRVFQRLSKARDAVFRVRERRSTEGPYPGEHETLRWSRLSEQFFRVDKLECKFGCIYADPRGASNQATRSASDATAR